MMGATAKTKFDNLLEALETGRVVTVQAVLQRVVE